MSNKQPTQAQSGPTTAVSFQEVSEHQAGQRLDNFLLSRLKGVPKSRIYRIIRKGEVRVNKKREKPDYKLSQGDIVRIPPVRVAAPNTQVPPSDALKLLLENAVLYSDDAILVLNKPSGLPVHGGTGVKVGLIEAMRQLIPDAEGLELAHRIDKGTSGCLLLARHGSALKALTNQFRQNTVKKTYHAIVEGHWPASVEEVGASLKRQEPQGGERFVTADSDGRSALTHFGILASGPSATLVQAMPVTGRTHQIRVHAQLAGHPIIGDEKYSDPEARKQFAKQGIKRLCLHARELQIAHPVTGEPISVTAPSDEQFEQAIRTLQLAGD